MKSKLQKGKELELGQKLLKDSQSVIFADFTGVDTASLRRLKMELKKLGGAFRVIKKRLLKIAFKNQGLDFDPTQFEAQVGVAFIPAELTDGGAGSVYKFSKELAREKKNFKILGAYEVLKKNFLNAEQFLVIAKLPSREVLLGQVMGMFTAPLRGFMFIVDQMSKKTDAKVES